MFELPVGFQDSSPNGLVFITPKALIVSHLNGCMLFYMFNCYVWVCTIPWLPTSQMVQMHSVCVPASNVGVSLNFELYLNCLSWIRCYSVFRSSLPAKHTPLQCKHIVTLVYCYPGPLPSHGWVFCRWYSAPMVFIKYSGKLSREKTLVIWWK